MWLYAAFGDLELVAFECACAGQGQPKSKDTSTWQGEFPEQSSTLFHVTKHSVSTSTWQCTITIQIQILIDFGRR